jgi:hypothetical protein
VLRRASTSKRQRRRRTAAPQQHLHLIETPRTAVHGIRLGMNARSRSVDQRPRGKRGDDASAPPSTTARGGGRPYPKPVRLLLHLHRAAGGRPNQTYTMYTPRIGIPPSSRRRNGRRRVRKSPTRRRRGGVAGIAQEIASLLQERERIRFQVLLLTHPKLIICKRPIFLGVLPGV